MDQSTTNLLVLLERLSAEVQSLHEKVDELLVDTRKARPLMDKYLNSPVAKWAIGSPAKKGKTRV